VARTAARCCVSCQHAVPPCESVHCRCTGAHAHPRQLGRIQLAQARMAGHIRNFTDAQVNRQAEYAVASVIALHTCSSSQLPWCARGRGGAFRWGHRRRVACVLSSQPLRDRPRRAPTAPADSSSCCGLTEEQEPMTTPRGSGWLRRRAPLWRRSRRRRYVSVLKQCEKVEADEGAHTRCCESSTRDPDEQYCKPVGSANAQRMMLRRRC
jgi:hypothetical protein